MATAIASFLPTVDASSGVIGGHHPSGHALSYILLPHNLYNGTGGGSGGQSPDYGGFTEESFEGESGPLEIQSPPCQSVAIVRKWGRTLKGVIFMRISSSKNCFLYS